MKLVYHRGDYDLKDYVYFWNPLVQVSQIVPLEIIGEDTSPYGDAITNWRRLVKKGLQKPKGAFSSRSGNVYLGTTLFLYGEGGMEFYWRGRKDVESILEEAIEKGSNCFLPFLGPRNPRRRD